MYTVIVILILVVSVLLGLVVLVQNSKGGGLISNFGSANQMMGVRQTTDFLEKATWTTAVVLVVLCLVSSMLIPRETQTIESKSDAYNEWMMKHQINTPTTDAGSLEAGTTESPEATE